MDRPTPTWVRIAAPLAIAASLIAVEPYLSDLVRVRPGVLPVAMAALIGLLLVPKARQVMVVVLCYGVAMLALRDAFDRPNIPPSIDYVWVGYLYPVLWGVLAILAGIAGTGEALIPGSVWARRCYFGAAALYLGGHGAITLLYRVTTEGVVLSITSLFALAGVFNAHRIVAAEMEEPQEEDDMAALHVADQRRAQMFASKEWKDPADGPSRAG